MSGQQVDPVEIARICQRAENNFVGVNCGIMDHYISRMGRKNHVLFIDCRTEEYELVPFESEDYQVVICDSKVQRGLVDSAYNERRNECEEAVAFFDESWKGK